MLRLVLPSPKYKASFLKALKEVKSAPKSTSHAFVNLDYKETNNNFVEFCKKINDQRKGIGIRKGFVPCTMYWLVDGDKYIGRVSIRHKLTPSLRTIGGHIGYEIRPSGRGRGYGTKILKLVLPKARLLGLKKVLLTCYNDNFASKKIIISNGGVQINEKNVKITKTGTVKFWIKL